MPIPYLNIPTHISSSQFNRLSTLSAQKPIFPASPPQAKPTKASNSPPPWPVLTTPLQKESMPPQSTLPLPPLRLGVIPKAAIKPITLTCKCPGSTFVANATAQGKIGPIKNPINAAETALTGTLGTNQKTNWMQRAMNVYIQTMRFSPQRAAGKPRSRRPTVTPIQNPVAT